MAKVKEGLQIEHPKKGKFVELYEKTGNVSACCKARGISRTTYYDWLKNDADFAAAVESAEETVLDKSEAQLKDWMFGNSEKGIEPNLTALIFFLKTKGKRRGYVERTEVQTAVTVEKTAYTLPDGTRLYL
jgi:hypothetical protein